MKLLKYIFTIIMLITTTVLVNGQSTNIPPEIFSSINAGDAAKLSSHLNSNVELVIENVNDVYSKQQASSIITDFFKKNKITSFIILHQGDKENASFAIGTLKTSNGDFRLYILVRKANKQTVIQQLRIEPSND